jgi:hypothetical protein
MKNLLLLATSRRKNFPKSICSGIFNEFFQLIRIKKLANINI